MAEHKIPVLLEELERESYHLFVEGNLHDKTLRLLVDTGASKSVFDIHFLNQHFINLVIEDSDDITGGLGASNIKSQYAVINNLSFGNFTPDEMRVAVLDLSHVNTSYERINRPPIHGIIGSDLLNKYDAIINYREQIITFSSL